MKTLALALLIPLAICAACAKKEESVATPAPVEAAANAPVADAAPVPAPAAVTAPAATSAPPATGAAIAAAPPIAHVTLISAAGSSVMGDLSLTSEGGAVAIRGIISGLAPGKEHGFHVHEVGDCSLPDFTSAGGHFNPAKDPHGGPKSKARHLGDIPNIEADKDGHASVDVTVKGVTLVDKDGAPTEILGKALVVHAMRDDYKTQPSGDSGARIACGVIR
jgi:Cu-Zn family superoxide dismutase